MKIKKTSLHARFYKFMYLTDKLPTNLCPYFWKLVMAIITLPLTFPSFIFTNNRSFGSRFDPLAIMIVLEMLIFGVGGLTSLIFGLVKNDDPMNLTTFGLINFAGILGWIMIALACYTAHWISERKEVYLGKKEKKPNIIIEYIKAKKNKACPMIEWED